MIFPIDIGMGKKNSDLCVDATKKPGLHTGQTRWKGC